jgi:hypothetical protein
MKQMVLVAMLLSTSLYACSNRKAEPLSSSGLSTNLTVMNNYPNAWGNECGIEGKSREGKPLSGTKAEGNRMKNRFQLPKKFTPMKFDEILKLPAKLDEKVENQGVEVIAYVQDIYPGGTKGETANCGATRRDLVDTHINLVIDPNNASYSGKGILVAEVTERVRRLGNNGALSFVTPKGNTRDWSLRSLKDRLTGRWVKLSGWLFFDRDHIQEDWRTDPEDSQGNENWRGHSWEIHPLMGIEVLNGKPEGVN